MIVKPVKVIIEDFDGFYANLLRNFWGEDFSKRKKMKENLRQSNLVETIKIIENTKGTIPMFFFVGKNIIIQFYDKEMLNSGKIVEIVLNEKGVPVAISLN